MNTLIIGFLIGCVFGAILFMGGATSYRRILGTLLLKDMWIIKLMCTAIGVGTLGIFLLDLNGLANLSIKLTWAAWRWAVRYSVSVGRSPAIARARAWWAPLKESGTLSSPF